MIRKFLLIMLLTLVLVLEFAVVSAPVEIVPRDPNAPNVPEPPLNPDPLTEETMARLQAITDELYNNHHSILDLVIAEHTFEPDEFAESEFFRRNLHQKGEPVLNFLIVHDLGLNHITIAHVDRCGISLKELKKIVDDSLDFFEQKQYNRGYLFLYEMLKAEIDKKKRNGLYCTLKVEKDRTCEVLINNGPPGDKIDVVFVDDGLLGEFEEEGRSKRDILLGLIENGLFSKRLFKDKPEYRNVFNFYFAKKNIVAGSGSRLCGHVGCDESRVLDMASVCPADSVIVLSSAVFGNYASLWTNVISISKPGPLPTAESFPQTREGFRNYLEEFKRINSLENMEEDEILLLHTASILTHEIGHIFGLRDEYYKPSNIDISHMPNCAPDTETARLWWGDLSGQGNGDLRIGEPGEFKGCSYRLENIRPTFNSIMNNHFASQSDPSKLTFMIRLDADFGLVNERWMINKVLSKYSTNVNPAEGVAQPPRPDEVVPASLDLRLQGIGVPPEFASIVSGASRNYAVEPELIAAKAKVESDWDPNAVSGAGAQGLTQLTSIAIQDIKSGKSAPYCRNVKIDDPFDPKQNIFAGTCYFKFLLSDEFDNDIELSLAAYNRGPTNINKLLDSCEKERGGRLCEWEDIRSKTPTETRNHVDRVLTAYNTYLGGRPPTIT